ncbi:MAG: alpha/beta fold hydrolase [Deltaproteobacteria bacterium]|nr:alpha/beta fold hydrolase [bacterium]MCB9489673.1 alpha/beta fold hydrolase [Deltaproteobacteria bacterium]
MNPNPRPKHLEIRTYQPSNNDGWRLYLQRVRNPERHDPRLKPILIIPGYGMNSFIFGYHPRGQAMDDYLAEHGFEVWSVNFRGADKTIREGGQRAYGFREIVKSDMPAAIDVIARQTASASKQVDLIGCSLGGTYVYAYAALERDDRVGSLVGMGAPLRWERVHPLLRIAFANPTLVGLIRLSNTRRLATAALPYVAKAPGLLKIYLHPEIVDLSRPEMLARTVEDPNPRLNKQIAHWVLNKDLMIDGANVSERLKDVTNPIYCMIANADGIVPEDTAVSVLRLAGSTAKDTVVCGDDAVRMAHADMFISNHAHERVFEPLARWLKSQQDTAS